MTTEQPTPQDLAILLEGTFDDVRLSSGERQAFAEALASAELNRDQYRFLRARAFDLVRSAHQQRDFQLALEWLERIVRVIEAAWHRSTPRAAVAEAHFSPGSACLDRILDLFARCRETADVCVFTITDDRISGAIRDAFRRGVRVRIVTDDDKAEDPGSDVYRLAKSGVPVRYDDAPDHMHHKFALFDGELLATGSFNWTRSASDQNDENLVVTSEVRLVAPFRQRFEALWERGR